MSKQELSLIQFDDFNAAEEYKFIWNKLAAQNPMLSWSWMKHWWNQVGKNGGIDRRLALVMVKNPPGQVIGIAPLYISANLVSSSIRFVGDGSTCTDYIDILALPQDRQEVAQKIANWIQSPAFQKRFGQLDSIVLEGLSQDARGIDCLVHQLLDSNWRKVENQMESSWSLDLRNGLDQVCTRLHYSQKRKFKKAIKRQQIGEFKLEVIDHTQSFANDWHDFVILHQKRRNYLKQPGCFVDCPFDQFLSETTRELVDQKRARIIFLNYRNHRISTNLLFFSEDRVFNYQNGSDPEFLNLEPGHALNSLAIAWSCQQGYQYYDFLRGDEPYKKVWGAERQLLYRYRLIAPRWSARAKETFRQAAKKVRDQSRSWLQNEPFKPNATETENHDKQSNDSQEIEGVSQNFIEYR